jgi:HD superfamily phosphohydrolase
MSALQRVPELAALSAGQQLIRIPDQTDVPVTPRIRRLIDSAAFARLRHVSQLGLVALVYPGATHSRFEHSLGVYRNALLYLQQLLRYPETSQIIGVEDVECFLVAALLHDLGHWPYCHPIEDLQLPGWPTHEQAAAGFLADGEIQDCLRTDWGLSSDSILRLLTKQTSSVAGRLLSTMLSGPIDIDKLDYLYRDSLHAGVPYGRQIDAQRIIASLCLNQAGDGLAISEKGRTAAELMVFARYVMFCEVYWHPAVRSATAMLQRAIFECSPYLTANQMLGLSDEGARRWLIQQSLGSPVQNLVEGLFGEQRRLYKRAAQFSFCESPDLFARLSRRPYGELYQWSQWLAEGLSRDLGVLVSPHEVLVDAPPVGLEVQFRVSVKMEKSPEFRGLTEISPVVDALAARQFDDLVKRVRIFVHPRLAPHCSAEQLTARLTESLPSAPPESSDRSNPTAG